MEFLEQSKTQILSALGLSAGGGITSYSWWSPWMTEIFSIVGVTCSLLIWWIILKLCFVFKVESDLGTAMTPNLPYVAFHNHVVWITGASSGIGRQMALCLCQNNAKLILSSRSKEKLEKVAEECRQLNSDVKVEILPLDLSDLKSLPGKAKDAMKFFGEIDMLINNGGVSTRVMADDCSFDLDQYLIKVDYLAHVCLTKALLGHFYDPQKKDPVTIINIGSIASKIGLPVRTPYCGAKHALVGYMDALRVESEIRNKNNIHILNAILGSTQTPIPYSAMLDYDASKNHAKTFSKNDPNIQAGLKVERVAERILAVAWQRQLPEVWLGIRRELIMLYLATYFPHFSIKLLPQVVGPQYAISDKKKA